jgi:hypothetical protein
MAAITGDGTRHPTGQHALWEEVCRLRALLRRGELLVDQLECLAVDSYPALYGQAVCWRQEVAKSVKE